ncbi:MAG: hypothetical protein PHP08_04650 [Candidatus Dojkabacteria bacterium]|nr:hypothetical protein [Candidatus Dojkabacteria bacterium]
MSTPQHTNQANGQWNKKPFLEQMANIGSEVYRAINWRNKGNEEYADMAFIRSLELFDLSKGSKLTSSQYRELTRMREIWVDYFKYDNKYNSTDEDINKYFMYITIASKAS